MTINKIHYISLLFCFIVVEFTHAQTSILPNNVHLQYTGRIDFSKPNEPVLYYAGSYITTRFEGTSLKASFKDVAGSSYIGFIIDGGEMIVKSGFNKNSASTQTIASGLTNATHDLIIVKRKSPGPVIFTGLTLDNGKSLVAPPVRPTRRIEIFGNSVSAGVNADNVATNDDRTTTLDNGWNAYGNILARKLNAEIHNNGIPGIAVMTGTGYYSPSADVAYNKLSPINGYLSNWNFSSYIPQLVIMAYGVNDDGNNWVNADNKETWKAKYKAILSDLMTKYPDAHFVFLVPPMGMDRTRMESFDQEIVNELNSPRVHFYNFTTAPSPGGAHPAKLMHQAMADELYDYVAGLGIFSSTSLKNTHERDFNGFHIYPNPTNGIFSVKLNSENKSAVNLLNINDLTGKSIFSEYLYSDIMKINSTELLQKGLYVVNLMSGNKNYSQKLFVK